MRIIAIFDYVSQSLLEILSKQLFNNLEKIPSDRTFNQDPHFTHVEIDHSQKLWSIDLTAATDRFPVSLQKQILSKLVGPDYAENWNILMTGSPFRHPYAEEGMYYSVGQPMGAKSSWPMFTLSHHIVVQCAALRAGWVKRFDSYILLGDDIVINNDKVAEKYIEIMKELGVETSESKTHVSSDTYEFAKRWINTKQGEITGAPLRGILTNINNIYILYNILFEYFQIRGNTFMFKGSIMDLCVSLVREFQIASRSRVSSYKSLLGKLQPYNLFMRISFGYATYDEIRYFFAVNVIHNDIYMVGPNLQVILSELDRVLGEVLVNQAWQAVKKISSIFDLLIEMDEQSTRLKDYSPHPLVRAIINNLQRLAKYSENLVADGITLKKAMEKSPLLDVEAIYSEERRKYLLMNMNASIALKTRTELRCTSFFRVSLFGGGNLQSTRAEQIVEETRDIHRSLASEFKESL